MKRIILLSIFFHVFASSAQLIADAGEYKTACKSPFGVEPMEIGGNPAAQGGVPPYTYSWHAHHQNTVGTFTFNYYASHFLDDTTTANPILVNFPPDVPVIFTLTVTDSEGAIDSSFVDISVSLFGINLSNISYNVVLGDSVYHDFGSNIGGGILPYQEVIWRPNEGLVDSTIYSGFWIKPTSSQNYYLTLTDAAGCTITGGNFIFVHVGYADLATHEIVPSLLYPNPTKSMFSIANQEQVKQVKIFDPHGRLVHQTSELPVDVTALPAGVYSVHVETMDKGILLEKLIVE